jgi:hypothetical protein
LISNNQTEEVGAFWRREPLLLIGVPEKIDVKDTISVGSFIGGPREEEGKSKGQESSGDSSGFE